MPTPFCARHRREYVRWRTRPIAAKHGHIPLSHYVSERTDVAGYAAHHSHKATSGLRLDLHRVAVVVTDRGEAPHYKT